MKRGVYLLALLGMLHGACGDDADEHDDKEQKQAPRKKVLSVPRLAAHHSLDPVKQFDVGSGNIVEAVYDRLLQYSYLERPYQLEPNLLAAMPKISSDGLTLELELREGVRFTDDPCFKGGKGRALTTNDVIYSLKRFADVRQNVKSYNLLRDSIVGMDEFRDKTKKLGSDADYDELDIAGVVKVDDRRLTIKLTRKNPLALYPFASSVLSIVPHEAVEHYGDRFEHHPVGTGPFRIKDYSRRGVIVLEKNPSYHLRYPKQGAAGDREAGLLQDAGKQLPLVDEVHLPLIEEAQPRMLMFLRGQLDWIPVDKSNFSKMMVKEGDDLFRLKPPYDKKFSLYWEPGLSTEYFDFNLKDPLLGKNRALRQAIAYAIDHQGYIDTMRNGRGHVLHTMVPLPIPGSERDIEFDGIERDLDKAKAKLAEAGYPGGKGLPPITIEYRMSSADIRQVHEYYRAQLAQIGIELEASYQTFSTFIDKMGSANFQMSSNGWYADYPDAENFYQLLYGKNTPPGPNYSGYDNPEYNKLYEQSRFMENGPERFALFRRMAELIARDVPVIVRWSNTRLGLYQRWLGNFKRNMMIDKPLQYLDIDAAAKSKGID